MRFAELVPVLQVAIGPVILVSGVGLLLLSMTNRYGRVIDRARMLSESARRSAAEDRVRLAAQLKILARRARLIRMSITFATLSVLLAAVMIISLFLGAMLHWELGIEVAVLFIACMASLIGALLVFLRDLNLSLAALQLETNLD